MSRSIDKSRRPKTTLNKSQETKCFSMGQAWAISQTLAAPPWLRALESGRTRKLVQKHVGHRRLFQIIMITIVIIIIIFTTTSIIFSHHNHHHHNFHRLRRHDVHRHRYPQHRNPNHEFVVKVNSDDHCVWRQFAMRAKRLANSSLKCLKTLLHIPAKYLSSNVFSSRAFAFSTFLLSESPE